MSKRVLCLLADGFEEIETVTPVDLLRRAGVEVVMAALGESRQVTGRSGIVIQADGVLSAEDAHTFDLLFIPGGPAVKTLRDDGRPAALVQQFMAVEKMVAAICAAPLVLQDAGALEGRRYTAHDSTYGELTRAEPGEAVIQAGNIITSRGAGTALAFGLAIVRHLCGVETAAAVAKAVMA